LEIKGERGATAFSLLRSFVDVATDLQRDGRYEEGPAVVGQAEKQLTRKLPKEAVSLLKRLESSLLACAGDLAGAQRGIEESTALGVKLELDEAHHTALKFSNVNPNPMQVLRYRSIVQRRIAHLVPDVAEEEPP